MIFIPQKLSIPWLGLFCTPGYPESHKCLGSDFVSAVWFWLLQWLFSSTPLLFVLQIFIIISALRNFNSRIHKVTKLLFGVVCTRFCWYNYHRALSHYEVGDLKTWALKWKLGKQTTISIFPMYDTPKHIL